MLGCCRRLVARASRRKRDTKCPSPASAAWRILRASRRPRFTCSARYTSPIPPSPSFFKIRYRPSRTVPITEPGDYTSWPRGAPRGATSGDMGRHRQGGGERLRHQLVAVTVHREDVPGLLVVVLELAAQLDDEVVHRAVGRVALDPPDLVEDLVPRHRLVGALVQELEHLDLVEGHRLGLAPPR